MAQAFGKKKLIKDISANTLQTAITQAFGLIIFYLTSRYLSKNDFGEYNWSMAVGTIIITIASLGLDVVFIKRIALSKNIVETSGIHFFHTLVAGVVLSALALATGFIFPGFKSLHPLFLLVFINLSIMNISNSFRLCLIGLEVYKSLALVALFSNVFKFALITWLYLSQVFTIYNVIYAFTASSVLELLLGYYFVTKKLSARVKPILRKMEYKYFILESLPQLGVVFFDSALARIDWILLGILSTAAITAEYSFAYRMYESSKLPLIIISPILLTRFSKLFNTPEGIDEGSKSSIQSFFKTELFVVMLIPIVLSCAWSPLMNYFTGYKYGTVNETAYLLLAACVPLHCISNFLWSMGFAQGQLKAIMFITIAVALINLLMNAVLIPRYGSNGAAFAFLISTTIQTLLYARYMDQRQIKLNVKTCIIAFINAIASVVTAKLLTNNGIFAVGLAVGMSIGLAFITRQLSIKQLKGLLVKA